MSKTLVIRQRVLNLLSWVKPERFDSFYVELKIGRILSKSITQTDKTNEYLSSMPSGFRSKPAMPCLNP
ncbi:MAG: hypothetical protein IPH31_23365 [Lewinellaceae bacterium]|nr:hypothetical protein [Lewinellaceae bacterium]